MLQASRLRKGVSYQGLQNHTYASSKKELQIIPATGNHIHRGPQTNHKTMKQLGRCRPGPTVGGEPANTSYPRRKDVEWQTKTNPRAENASTIPNLDPQQLARGRNMVNYDKRRRWTRASDRQLPPATLPWKRLEIQLNTPRTPDPSPLQQHSASWRRLGKHNDEGQRTNCRSDSTHCTQPTRSQRI